MVRDLPSASSIITETPRACWAKSTRLDPEQDVDSGEALARLVQHVGEVGAMHDDVGRAEALLHDLAQGAARPAACRRGTEKTSMAPGRCMLGLQVASGAEAVEDAAGVGADLQAGAEFLDAVVALEHDDAGAELGERRSASVSPEMPAPAMTNLAFLGGIGVLPAAQAFSGFEDGRKRHRGAGRQPGIEHVMGRAVGADDLVVLAHVDVDMRMIEGGQGADAHEFPVPISICATPSVLWKCGTPECAIAADPDLVDRRGP